MKKLPYILSLLVLLSAFFGTRSVQAQDRKGWSPQAKGAVIGGLGGAAAGAIINKRNRPVGGVIGGVAGGAIGYGVGKHIDNKQKERARIAEANRVAAIREDQYRYAARRAASNDSRRAKSSSRTQSTPTNALVAAQPAPAYMANGQQPAALNSAYLPNDANGDTSHPYATSEYRRKSW